MREEDARPRRAEVSWLSHLGPPAGGESDPVPIGRKMTYFKVIMTYLGSRGCGGWGSQSRACMLWSIGCGRTHFRADGMVHRAWFISAVALGLDRPGLPPPSNPMPQHLSATAAPP